MLLWQSDALVCIDANYHSFSAESKAYVRIWQQYVSDETISCV